MRSSSKPLQIKIVNYDKYTFTCSLIEYMGRDRKRKRSEIVDCLGRERLERIYRYADVLHCEPIAKAADEFITQCQIRMGNMIMLKNAATLQNVTAGRRFCDKILFLRRKIMSRFHMVITAIGAIFFLWFALPSFAIFSIGSVTGMALSALVVFYGIFYQRVHIFLNFLWRNFAGKTVLICMSLFLLVVALVALWETVKIVGAAMHHPRKIPQRWCLDEV